MDFRLSEEQSRLKQMVREFHAREVDPAADEIDRTQRLPEGLIGKMAQKGLFGMTIPKGYGGGDSDNLSVILACEELAYSGTGVWWLLAFHNSIPACIHRFGTEKIRERYLVPLCNGTAYASIQFTEEDTGSDPGALRTTALPVGNGESYSVNGMKRFSTFGARSGYALLFAKDETGRCTAWLLPKLGPGYTVTKHWDLAGGGGMEAVDVHYENVCVHSDSQLGEKGKGFDLLIYWISTEKIEQCAASVGMAQAALDESIRYARFRTARGQPMAKLQGIQWMLSEIYTQVAAARLFTYQAALSQDQEETHWIPFAAAAKSFVMPAVLKSVDMARQIHGAYGYNREFKIERLYRAALGATAIATSLEINKSIVGSWLVK